MIFKSKINTHEVFIFNNVGLIKSIAHKECSPSFLYLSDGEQKQSACMRCVNPRCINFPIEKIDTNWIADFPKDISTKVCPVDCIEIGESGIPIIKSNECISCGLCALACPVGAIYAHNGNFYVNNVVNDPTLFAKKSSENLNHVNLQRLQIEHLSKIPHTGSIIDKSTNYMKLVYDKIENNVNPNIFVRNILILLGISAASKRNGDVYTRMDLIVKYRNKIGEAEIEFGEDTLSASRRILDDIAMLKCRYNIPIDNNIPIVITLKLPNKRQGFWQVVSDINNVLNIKINTVTVGALLILCWHFSEFIPEKYYIDSSNMKIKELVESEIGMKINEDIKGIFNPEK